MKENQKREIEVLPDYLEGVDDQTIHIWRRWRLVTKEIDEHPLRFTTVCNERTGEVRIIDSKGNATLQYNAAKKFGASEEEAQEVRKNCEIIQKLQQEKSRLNKNWNTKVFNRKKGEKPLLEIRSQEIMDMYGKFFTAEEIQRVVLDKWGISVSLNVIRKFYTDYKEKIDRLRAKYIIEGKEIRLGTDAGRLELLSRMAFEWERKFDKNHSVESSKELRAIIEQIRKEVKGEEIKLTIDGRIDVNATIQANQTINEALQQLPINMIIIGLTAARKRINPASLMGLLANSYYSRFNGFNKLNDLSQVELPGKYIKQYNWEEIRQRNESNIQDVQPIEEYVNDVQTQNPKFQLSKSRLMKKLEELKAISEGN